MVFMSSSVPGEVRPARTHLLPGLMPAFVFAFTLRLSPSQMRPGARSTARMEKNLHFLRERLLNSDALGAFSVYPPKL